MGGLGFCRLYGRFASFTPLELALAVDRHNMLDGALRSKCLGGAKTLIKANTGDANSFMSPVEACNGDAVPHSHG